MIDFKNYERLTTRFDDGRPAYACSFRWEPENEEDLLDRLAELEDMIEQGKLVEKIEPKTTLTNREYLNNLSNEELARAIATKVATTQEPNFNEGLKYTEIINDIQIDFEEWLNDEYKE